MVRTVPKKPATSVPRFRAAPLQHRRQTCDLVNGRGGQGAVVEGAGVLAPGALGGWESKWAPLFFKEIS